MFCFFSVLTWVLFRSGEWACRLEAVFHVTAIIAQFGCNALMAIRNYLSIVHRQKWPESRLDVWMFRLTIGVYVFAYISVISFTPISGIYLVSSGVYCFFPFHSVNILMLVGFLVGAIIVMIFCYAGIFKEWRRTRLLSLSRPLPGSSELTPSHPPTAAFASNPQLPNQIAISVTIQTVHRRQPSDVEIAQMTIRIVVISVLNVGALLIGWGFAVAATITELGEFGEATEVETVGVGVGGVLNSVFQPMLQFAFRDVHRSYMADRLSSIGAKCGCPIASSDVSPNRSKTGGGMLSTSGGPTAPAVSRRNGISSARTPAAVSPPAYIIGEGDSQRTSDYREAKSPSVSPAASTGHAFSFRPPVDLALKAGPSLAVPISAMAGKSRRATAPASAGLPPPLALTVQNRSIAPPDNAQSASSRDTSRPPPLATARYRPTSPPRMGRALATARYRPSSPPLGAPLSPPSTAPVPPPLIIVQK